MFACGKGEEVVKEQPSKTAVQIDHYTLAMESAAAFEKSGFTNNDDYETALSNFEMVTATERMHADAWFNMGRILFYKGEIPRAKESLKNAITYRSNFVEAYSLLTKIYLLENNLNAALSLAEKANELVPGNNVLMNNLAVLYIKTGDLPSAKKIVEGLIRHNTKFTPAYITLGNVYYLEGKYEMARFIYLKALDEGEDSGDLYTNIGIIAIKLDEGNNALGFLKKAEEKSPNNPYVLNNVGEYYLSAGDFDGAIKEFNAALKINPKMIEALVNLGVAYSNVKLFNEAEDIYKKALSYDPSFPEAYFNYGVFLIDHRDQNVKALAMFNKYLVLKGKEISDKHRVYRYIEEINQKKKGSKK